MHLRSGTALAGSNNTGLAIMSNPSTAHQTETTTMPSNQTSQPTLPGINVLPQSTACKLFTGTDPSYNAYTFISACEDVMNSLRMSDPSENISYVRSQCDADSEAGCLLRTRPLLPAHVSNDYDKFKENF